MEKFKRHIRLALRQLQRIAGLLPRTVERAYAKHIRAVPAEGMPVAGRKTQMLFHAFTQYDFIWIIMAES